MTKKETKSGVDLSGVRFVLVGPQSGGNVGAAARALRNLGFSRLDLVAPECDPLGEEARRMAVGGAGLLGRARVHASLDEALDGAGAVIGTSRRVGRQRRPHFRLDALAPDLARLAAAGGLAFVFGREDSGLTDAELDRCTHLVHFLASEELPSYNLAQSVLLAAYTLRLSLAGPAPDERPQPLADHASREAALGHLEAALLAIGFLREDTAEGMMRRIRRILGRADLTPGDAQIVRGIARQVLWLARTAGLPVPSEAELPRPAGRGAPEE
jgi:TrmH family RNA methyltransferase